MVSIEISNVRKEFGAVSVLKGINLSIASGEFAVLVGPSGCGKSTLLRLIAGLDEASSGDVLIGGRRVNNLPPRDRDIAMVFQSYALYPHMNVHDNMAYSLKLKRTPTARIAEAVAMAASKLGLETLVARKPRELSGGQRQRVAMGRAIVRNPTAFLFDEPLSNLDARMREQMRFEIRKLHRELGATSVYVTHDQIEAMTMADRIVAMDAGVIQQVGTPLELYDDPANMFVAGFIGSPAMNFLDARARRGEGGTAISVGGAAFCTLPQSLALPDDTRVTIGIRPERIAIGAGPSPSVEAVVDLVETTGPANIIHVDLAGQAMKIFTTERLQLVHGQRVPLAFDPAHVCLFDGASGIRLR